MKLSNKLRNERKWRKKMKGNSVNIWRNRINQNSKNMTDKSKKKGQRKKKKGRKDEPIKIYMK